ncbi:uncharacterized protein LOC107275162 [Cephus cinctus]|uniref:Uncharacterized protein LOC107275162 n=1 Tax=Cephus cinctus TaxID=211228 RepID=A0AAJ7CHN3_CEPCN|nr:uncharacterized protein LOC107275162 [Cephus cinctus]
MATVRSLSLGIFLAGITSDILGVSAWDPRVQQYVGYDLEKGPVLYEAYYPDEQTGNEKQKSPYQEKRYFDRGTVLERSYQLPEDPYEIPYGSINAKPSQSQLQSQAYERSNLPYTVGSDRSDQNGMAPTEYPRDFPASNNEPGDGLNVPSGNPAYEQESRNYLRGKIENAEYLVPIRIPYIRELPATYSVPADEIIFGEPYSVEEGQVEAFGNSFDDPRSREYASRRRELNPIPRRGSNLENLQLRNGEVRSMDTNFRDSPRYGGTDLRKVYNENYKEFRDSPADPVPMENIFAPRPQVINYVLSPVKKSDSTISTAMPKISTPRSEDYQRPRNYGDNLINDQIIREEENELKRDEARVASIEVSEVPRHKTRHHHGERPRRNYSQR